MSHAAIYIAPSPRDEDGEDCEALQPKLTMNPLTQRVFQCITDRALNPGSTLPDVDPGLAHMLEPSPALVAQCTPALDCVRVSEVPTCIYLCLCI